MAIARVIHENVRSCRTVAFDEHALRRMQERGVSEDDVLNVLRNPDRTNLPAGPGRLRFRRNHGSGSWVDVIFEEDPTQIVVITVLRKQ